MQRPRRARRGRAGRSRRDDRSSAAHGPTRTRSISPTWPRAMAEARVTLTEPPPAATVVLPLLEVVPLLRVACNVAPPQADGTPLTGTLTTLEPDRTWSTPRPAAVHRGAVALAAPSEPPPSDSDAASATPTVVASRPSARAGERRARRGSCMPLEKWIRRRPSARVAAGLKTRIRRSSAADHHADARHGRSADGRRERCREARASGRRRAGRLTERCPGCAVERDLVGLRVAGGREPGDGDRADRVAGRGRRVRARVRRGHRAGLTGGDGGVGRAEAVGRQVEAGGEAIHGAERQD